MKSTEKTEKINVLVRYEIKYEHKDHREYLLKEIRKNLGLRLTGAGIIDGKAYNYEYKRISEEGPE